MEVWVVEHRKKLLSGDWEIVVSFVGSSIEKVTEFVSRAEELTEPRDPKQPWWFAAYRQKVDRMNQYSAPGLCFFDWYGKPMNYQPVDGYE